MSGHIHPDWPKERELRKQRKKLAAEAVKVVRKTGEIENMGGYIPSDWPKERELRKQQKKLAIEAVKAVQYAQLSYIHSRLNFDAKFTVISYYTINTGYQDEIKNLIASLDKFALSYHIEGIKSFGNWQANTHYKARFIRKMLDQINGPVLFLDADAVIQQYPSLFDEIKEDFAAYFKDKFNLLSGTLYFKNNPNIKSLIDEWIFANNSHKGTLEQQVLSDILPRWINKITIYKLPPIYCQIFDLMKDAGEPVIEHFQASRKFKKIVNNFSSAYGKLAILVPTKNRPKSIVRFVESVLKTATDLSRIRFYFCIPIDDYGSRNIIKAMNNPNIFVIDEKKLDEVNLSKFWNQLYEASRDWADYFGYYGDDVEFQTKDWDNQVVVEFKKHDGIPWLIQTNDKYQSTIAVLFWTNQVLHNIAGYYMPEYYRNVGMDTHWSYITHDAGCHTFLDKVITYHYSCSINKAPIDDTHRGCRTFANEDTRRLLGDREKKVRAEMVNKIKDLMLWMKN